jgi:tetratricopeptide (TPR) repeat protein
MTGPEDDLPTLISRNDHLNVLRYIRAHKLREPRIVVKHGMALLGIGATTPAPRQTLGDAERLSALEQMCASALDLGDASLADRCIAAIGETVPAADGGGAGSSSVRRRRLLGMRLESSGEYDDASSAYDGMLRENPSNAHAARRRYCVAASRSSGGGKAGVEAASALDDYLRSRPGDVAAWHEMAEVCLASCDYAGAAYCLEEVVLGCPLDSNVHVRLAEAYCTAGGLSNAKLGRKHMAQAVQLDPDNLRAWYGLIAASEGYLDEVERIPTSGGGKNGGGGGGSRREAEEEGVEVAWERILRYRKRT